MSAALAIAACVAEGFGGGATVARLSLFTDLALPASATSALPLGLLAAQVDGEGRANAAFWIAVAAYALLVLGAGWLANRRASRSPEEYFLAGRGLGSAVLFMALFGTNCTAFVLVGVPGLAYHAGVGTFSINAPLVALVIPLTFLAIGLPARRLGRELGALTPAELYAKRLDSRAVGVLLFVVYTVYTLPYMVTAVEGAAVTLHGATGGAVAPWIGGAAVLGVALVYTSLGGMRATAWTNVIQGALFLGFMVVAFVVFGRHVGGDAGLVGAFERVATERPDLYELPTTGLFSPAAWSSWSLAIALTVIAFPHMLVRLMSADSERSIRSTCRLYPPALVVLWLPAVMIGVWGAVAFPGLVGKESDRVFAMMVTEAFPPALQAFGFLAVLAAVMSTLDAQILTLGSMLTRDVIDPLMPNRREARDVTRGRLFGVAIAVAVFVLWQVGDDSIFSNAAIAFSGYVTLVPTLLLGVRWRRFTGRAALASILCGNAVYVASLWHTGANAMAPSWGGFLPVFWGLAAATVAAVVGSRAGTLPRESSSQSKYASAALPSLADWREALRIDGSLRDLYVFDTRAEDWDRWLERLATSRWTTRCTAGGSDVPMPLGARAVFPEPALDVVLTVDLGGVLVACHAFEVGTIECSLDPRELDSDHAIALVQEFMRELGACLDKDVVLAAEGVPDRRYLEYAHDLRAFRLCPAPAGQKHGIASDPSE